MSEEKEKLLRLMQDTESFEKLSKWTNRINIFDILKISRMEIRHSNVLSWLLDPNESHGLGDSFLYAFLCKLSNSLEVNDALKILTSDLYSYTVLREWNNIDIFLVSKENQIAIAIENKIGAHEHKKSRSEYSQLVAYKDEVKKNYEHYTNVFVYLTPEGEIPSEESWIIVTYFNLLELLEKLYEAKKSVLKEEVNLLIKNYIVNLKKNVIMDEELIKLCNEIYKKHREALDLIYDNKDDIASRIAALCKTIITNKGFELEDSNRKSYIKFRTNSLKTYFKGLDKLHYFYQFQIRPKDDYMILELVYHKEESTPLDSIWINKMKATIPPKNKKLGDTWQWRRVWSTKIDEINLKSDEELNNFIAQSIQYMVGQENKYFKNSEQTAK